MVDRDDAVPIGTAAWLSSVFTTLRTANELDRTVESFGGLQRVDAHLDEGPDPIGLGLEGSWIEGRPGVASEQSQRTTQEPGTREHSDLAVHLEIVSAVKSSSRGSGRR